MEAFNESRHEPVPAANDNQEAANQDLEIHARTTAEILRQELTEPELIENLTTQIENNPQLQKRLNLENKDHLEIELEIAKATQNIETSLTQLTDIIELMVIAYVNPKALVKKYKQIASVMGHQNAIIEEMESKLADLRSDENQLKVVAGYLGKLILQANPAKAPSKLITQISTFLGIINEEENQQMQETAKAIQTPTLNTWILFQIIKANPDLAQDIYKLATDANQQYKDSKNNN